MQWHSGVWGLEPQYMYFGGTWFSPNSGKFITTNNLMSSNNHPPKKKGGEREPITDDKLSTKCKIWVFLDPNSNKSTIKRHF